MNNLHPYAVRRHAANTFHRHKASNGLLSRFRSVVPVSTAGNDKALPLRAHWFRNPLSGTLECRWVSEAPAEPLPHMRALRRSSLIRMHRRAHRAGMRPPTRKYGNG